MDGFGEFYLETNKNLFYYILKSGFTSCDAEDLCQEVYLCALGKWDKLKKYPQNQKYGWLYICAKYKKNDFLKYKRRYSFEPLSENTNIGFEEFEYELIQVKDVLNSCLSNTEAQLINYLVFEGLGRVDICRIMGINYNTLKTRIYRLRKKLSCCIELKYLLC